MSEKLLSTTALQRKSRLRNWPTLKLLRKKNQLYFVHWSLWLFAVSREDHCFQYNVALFMTSLKPAVLDKLAMTSPSVITLTSLTKDNDERWVRVPLADL